MKYFLWILFLIQIMSSCKLVDESKTETPQKGIIDTSTIEMHSTNSIDLNSGGINSNSQLDTIEIEPINGKKLARFNRIKDIYTLRYLDTLVIDTSFYCQQDTIILNVRHYCTNDSLLVIPSEYYFTEEELITHSFESQIHIFSNNNLVIDTSINRNVFDKVISNEFREYGALLSPYYRNYNHEDCAISIGYSISVPATDIGIGVKLIIELDGSLIPEKR